MLAATAGYLAMGPMTVLLPKLATARLGLSELGRGYFLGIARAVTDRRRAGRAGAGPPSPPRQTILAATLLAGVLLAALGGARVLARRRSRCCAASASRAAWRCR